MRDRAVLPTTARFTIEGAPVDVSAVQTGTITVKRSHHTCCVPERTPMAARFAGILADRRWADPMPIWAFVIQHPTTVAVVDAGITPAFNDPSSWEFDRSAGRILRSFLRIEVCETETLPSQLVAIGIDPAAVDALVLTHQHIDHTASVPAFANATVWTTNAEDRAASQIGACSWRWRDSSTKVRYIDVDGQVTRDGLGASLALTHDGSLQAIHTPGHTPGSVSVTLSTDQCDLWFTGDTSFTAATMNPNQPTAGIHTDMRAVRALQRRLHGAGVILPSHDWGNADRLLDAGISD